MQRPIRDVIRGSALAPFLSAQATLAYRRSTTVDVHALRAQRDSLAQTRDLVGPALAIAALGAVESLLSAGVAGGMIGGRHRSARHPRP